MKITTEGPLNGLNWWPLGQFRPTGARPLGPPNGTASNSCSISFNTHSLLYFYPRTQMNSHADMPSPIQESSRNIDQDIQKNNAHTSHSLKPKSSKTPHNSTQLYHNLFFITLHFSSSGARDCLGFWFNILF